MQVSHRVDIYDDLLALGIGRHSTEALFTPVLENKSDGRGETFASLLFGVALSIGPRNFGAIRDDPVVASLIDRRELVPHFWCSGSSHFEDTLFTVDRLSASNARIAACGVAS